jgi:hypothetical protein
MTTAEYINEAIAGWMERNAPDALASIRASAANDDLDHQNTTLADWMAENAPDALSFMRTVELSVSENPELSREELDCSLALIRAVYGAFWRGMPDDGVVVS